MTIKQFKTLFSGCELPDKAVPARQAVADYLVKLGFTVRMNVPMDDSDYPQFIEIIARREKDNLRLVIEVDRRMPGSRAINKFAKLPSKGVYKLILLRNPDYKGKILDDGTYCIGIGTSKTYDSNRLFT